MASGSGSSKGDGGSVLGSGSGGSKGECSKLASGSGSKSMGSGSGSRATNIKIMDDQLGKLYKKDWSKNLGTDQQWENIDSSKLEISSLISQAAAVRTVYRGTYNTEEVAIKLLDWKEDGQTDASFKREVEIWKTLDHPNVTRFIGASNDTKQFKLPSQNPLEGYPSSRPCCVVVEFLSGGTLKNYLYQNRNKKLPLKTVVQLALDLAKGLSYLHSKKIVHRNMKSKNMLLDANNTLKISGFGVARVEVQNSRDMTGATGTMGYMAPEILEGKPYNRKCDVYSFGICLWEIYCCDLHYVDLSFVEASAGKNLQRSLQPDIPRCCPSSLKSIMKKCWDSDPEKRPEMDQVVMLLEAVNTSKGGGMIPDDQAGGRCFCFAPTRGP